MIRRPPRSTRVRSSAASDVYKRQGWDGPTAPEQEPEALVLLGQRQQLLWQHVQQLPPRCRALMRVIAFAERPDYAQIALSLGMPVGSIGPTRGRCLAK